MASSCPAEFFRTVPVTRSPAIASLSFTLAPFLKKRVLELIRITRGFCFPARVRLLPDESTDERVPWKGYEFRFDSGFVSVLLGGLGFSLADTSVESESLVAPKPP